MTAGELLALVQLAVAAHGPDLEVILRVADDDGCTYLGALASVSPECGCTEVLALMLDGYDEPREDER